MRVIYQRTKVVAHRSRVVEKDSRRLGDNATTILSAISAIRRKTTGCGSAGINESGVESRQQDRRIRTVLSARGRGGRSER